MSACIMYTTAVRRYLRALIILIRKFAVVAIGATAYGYPLFAVAITTVSLFIAFVLQKAYNPYRSNSVMDSTPALGDLTSGKSKLK